VDGHHISIFFGNNLTADMVGWL